MKKQIPTDQHITYQLQFRKCGKSSCSTCRRSPGHGPYWYAYWRTGSKLISGYIGKTRSPQYQQQPHRQLRHHRLQQTLPSTPEPQALPQDPTQTTQMEVTEPVGPVESIAAAVSIEPVETTTPVLEAAAICI